MKSSFPVLSKPQVKSTSYSFFGQVLRTLVSNGHSFVSWGLSGIFLQLKTR